MKDSPISKPPRYLDWSLEFKGLPLCMPEIRDEFFLDCFGGKTRKVYSNPSTEELKRHSFYNILEGFGPSYSEDYYDYADLVQSILAAKQPFCMVELGAGYGRWLVHGANACKLMNKPLGTLIGCEAEPTHYQWMVQHFKDNGLNLKNHKLVEGIVAEHDGELPFYTGNPDGWYGQSIAQNVIDYGPSPQENLFKKIIKKLVRRDSNGYRQPPFKYVRCYTLNSLLDSLPLVDFMHVDIQGAEYDVLAPAMGTLNQKVKKIHIGTHSPDVEPTKGRDMDMLIYNLFKEQNWVNINRVPPLSQEEKDGHVIHFVDGVQTWSNPFLAEK